MKPMPYKPVLFDSVNPNKRGKPKHSYYIYSKMKINNPNITPEFVWEYIGPMRGYQADQVYIIMEKHGWDKQLLLRWIREQSIPQLNKIMNDIRKIK